VHVSLYSVMMACVWIAAGSAIARVEVAVFAAELVFISHEAGERHTDCFLASIDVMGGWSTVFVKVTAEQAEMNLCMLAAACKV
jgi:hypothetical protein